MSAQKLLLNLRMKWITGLGLLVLMYLLQLANAQAKSETPQLVLETGGHRALITAIHFTPDGRELISVSHDKTIRVWNISEDPRQTTLLRTIRGQIGEGQEGVLWAAALSPAIGESPPTWLAVGGTLGGTLNSERYAVRLHDYESGEVAALLIGHNDKIFALAFSPDGRWLASAGKDQTIRIWDVTLLKGQSLTAPPLVLTGHANHVYDLDWSKTGHRLASASYDHTIGLWDTTSLALGHATLIDHLRSHRGPVRTVAFHPNSRILVSGGEDKAIRKWQSSDGRSQDVFVDTGHKVSALSFSRDGSLLLAGNLSPPRPKQLSLFTYPNGRRQQAFTGHNNTVVATAFHPSGKWVASGGGDQKEILLWNAQTANIISRLEGAGQTIYAVAFSIEKDMISWGSTSRFRSSNNRGELEHRFDLIQLTRKLGPIPLRKATRARERVGKTSLQIERGGPRNDDFRLKIRRKNGLVHKHLGTIDRSTTDGYWHSSYTLTPDGQHILSGGLNGVLRLYALDGSLIAALIGHTGEIKSIAVSQDGQWALSGANDQTLKLWSLANLMTSGKSQIQPALTIFPARNGEWIAWTPEGFFTASEQGRQLIGYVVNQGVRKVATYISIDQLYDRFYRPDLIEARFKGDPQSLWHEESAKTDAKTVLKEGLPPQVIIVSPTGNLTVEEEVIDVLIRITDQGGGIGKTLWQIDGVMIGSDSGKILPELEETPNSRERRGTAFRSINKRVALLPGQNSIQVTAYDALNRVASTPALLKVGYRPLPKLTLSHLSPPKPSLHVLSIGIDHYRDKALQLEYAISDGEALAETLRDRSGPLFENIIITHLFNEKVTFEGLDTTFKKLSQSISPNDVFILHMAGHGVTQNGRYYFLPQDFRYFNPDSIASHAINQGHLQQWLSTIPARKSLVLLDTCESGSFAYSLSAMRGMSAKTAVAKLSRATGRATIVASTEDQPALEGYKGHGLFTYVLLEAFHSADEAFGNHDGYISLLELASYVSNRVPELSRRVFEFEQVPQVHILGTDFHIAAAGRVP